jgi:hypothetical protein
LKNKLIEKYLYNKMIVTCSILLFTIFYILYLLKSPKFNEIILILLMMSAILCLLLIGKLCSSVLKKSIYKNIAYASFCM